MVHVMCVALLFAPVANVCTQLANLLSERTVARYRVGAKVAYRCALNTAGGTVICALGANHMRKTNAALGRASIAGGNAVLGKLVHWMIHSVIHACILSIG